MTFKKGDQVYTINGNSIYLETVSRASTDWFETVQNDKAERLFGDNSRTWGLRRKNKNGYLTLEHAKRELLAQVRQNLTYSKDRVALYERIAAELEAE